MKTSSLGPTKALLFAFSIILIMYLASMSNKFRPKYEDYESLHQVIYSPSEVEIHSKLINSYIVGVDEKRVVEKLRNLLIEPPSTDPYNLANPEKTDYSNGQTPFIDSRLGYKEKGFFIECGALDGEKGSNTLFFEKSRNWSGILIEADPANYAMLKLKRRKAFTLNACLSPSTLPQKIAFNKAYNRGRLMHNAKARLWMKKHHLKPHLVTIECFPIHFVLQALNRTKIDYFSLDVEGDELNVLKTIPFDKISIDMLSVEYLHGGDVQSELQTFMEHKGYQTILKMMAE